MAISSSELGGGHLKAVLIIDVSFGGTTYRVFSGRGILDIFGHTYIGAGLLISLSDVSEDPQPTPRRLTMTLSGADVTLRLASLKDNYQGREVRIRLVFIDVDEGLIIAQKSFNVFSGLISHAVFSDDFEAGRGTISFHLTTRLADHRGIPQSVYSPASQKHILATDTSCDRLPTIALKEIRWGFGGFTRTDV